MLPFGWLLWLLAGIGAFTFVLVENGVPDNLFSAVVLVVAGGADLWFIWDAVHEVRMLRRGFTRPARRGRRRP